MSEVTPLYARSFFKSLIQVGTAKATKMQAPPKGIHSRRYASHPIALPAPMIARNSAKKIPIFFNVSILKRFW